MEKFDISRLKGKLGVTRDWMTKHHLPPKLVFFAMGALSTLWFLIRVIPKPSRASYPCMRVAAPVMSGFVMYLLSLGGLTVLIRKARQSFSRSRYIPAVSFLAVALIAMLLFIGQDTLNSYAVDAKATGPDDGPNQPMGTGQGVNPGRVVWVWNPDATNIDCINVYDMFKPENTNQAVVNKMVNDGISRLAGDTDLHQSWDALFHAFNIKRHQQDKGYTPGEKIFIKINQGTANGRLRNVDETGDFDISERFINSYRARGGESGACETYPSVVLEILRQLVNEAGVDQKDIAIGDPIAHIYGYNYKVWAAEFPDVVYVDKLTGKHGRTLVSPTENDLVFYSDQTQSDKLYDIIENADYLINVANLKPHGRAGVSLTAKNHFGSHGRRSAYHLHYSLISPVSMGNPSNSGYHKYRVQVDMMGSEYLGRNTLLYVVDGLYGGGAVETGPPVKYYMPPFNNDWSNSIFISQDQVALESVCYDFLRTEWNGTYKHSPTNNRYENIPNVNGVDDYLHQAADPANWPKGIVYDPDHSGTPLTSLGVHEHWNDAARKQYSRNLGLDSGIELLSVPDSLTGKEGPLVTTSETWLPDTPVPEPGPDDLAEMNQEHRHHNEQHDFLRSIQSQSFDGVSKAKKFYAIVVDDNNTKWFLTDAGIVSYNGKEWKSWEKNKNLPDKDVKGVAFNFTDYRTELWLATPKGASVATVPLDATTRATTLKPDNSELNSKNVVAIAVGRGNGSKRWFGTDKGIAAFYQEKWLTPDYQKKYPESLFKDFPITCMATSRDGDSLYVATKGAGVARVYRNDVDAITSASEYAQWGPIKLPSDNVNAICITRDGTQWFGTDAGAARHTGYVTMKDWTVLDTKDGLVDDIVQAIAVDHMGCVWFGTPKGLSFYDNASIRSFTDKDGLPSSNVLSIVVDREGAIWIGTDNGLVDIDYLNGKIVKYVN